MTNEADTPRKNADPQQMRVAVNKPTLSPTHRGPHVFILGAGASRAASPDGDKNGKKIPLMNDLIEIVGIQQSCIQGVSAAAVRKTSAGVL